jgi:phosphatidylethanolamine-binding protein (PEBP) family uncharacterized protein
MSYRRTDSDLPGGHARRHLGMAARSPRRARKGRARAWLARATAAALLVACGAIAGCGGASASSSSSPNPKQLVITSPVLTSSGTIPAQYTCSGRNIPPPMQWGNIPSGTAELALFLLDLGHTEVAAGGATQAKLTVGWSVRGLSPSLHGIAAGKLPAGAIVGRKRYTICPPKGGTGEYLFRLYALPSRVSASSHLSDLELFRQINKASSAAGFFTSTFTRS